MLMHYVEKSEASRTSPRPATRTTFKLSFDPPDNPHVCPSNLPYIALVSRRHFSFSTRQRPLRVAPRPDR